MLSFIWSGLTKSDIDHLFLYTTQTSYFKRHRKINVYVCAKRASFNERNAYVCNF